MRKFKLILDILFYFGVALGGYSLYKTFVANKDLPVGVCPVDNYRFLMYCSIFILIASMGLQEFVKRNQKHKNTLS